MIRFGKKSSRTFLEAEFGLPWSEIEREYRRRKPIDVEGIEVAPAERELRLRTPIGVQGTEVIGVPIRKRKARRSAAKGT